MAKKAIKKRKSKKTPEQQALEKEVKRRRNNAKRLVSSASKRGYSFPENIIPELPKNITEGTLRKFKKYTPEYLYSKAVYVSPEGIEITGSKRRTAERSESSKKAAEKRATYYSNKEPTISFQDYIEQYTDESEPPDYSQFLRDYQEQYGEGTAPTPEDDTVLRRIEDMIDSWAPSAEWTHISTLTGPLSDYKEDDKNKLKSALLSALFEQGRNEVAKRAQKNADQLIYLANRVLYESGSSYKTRGVEGVNRDIQLFKTLLTGVTPTVQESQEFSYEAERLSLPYNE